MPNKSVFKKKLVLCGKFDRIWSVSRSNHYLKIQDPKNNHFSQFVYPKIRDPDFLFFA